MVGRAGLLPAKKRLTMTLLGGVFGSRAWYEWCGRVARVALRMVPGWLARRTAWGRERELPVGPKESFREWYQRSGRG